MSNRATAMTDFTDLKQQILEKWTATGMTADITNAVLINWEVNSEVYEVYEVHVTFAKGTHELKTPYHMGIGLFEANDIQVEPFRPGSLHPKHYKPQQPLCDTLPESITQKYFKPEIIFACVCEESQNAMNLTVEDYCSQLYGNSDSHKGHQTHAKAIRQYQLLNYMVGQKVISDFAKLYREL